MTRGAEARRRASTHADDAYRHLKSTLIHISLDAKFPAVAVKR